MMGKSTRNDSNLKAKVDQLVSEVLGKQPGGVWYKSSRVEHYRLIADNAMIKFPQVSISCGNSIAGIFNIEEARKVTMKLFDAYGIPLEPQVFIAGEGYRFEADGFNAELGVGFEIREDGHYKGYWTPNMAEEASGESYLGHSELVELEKDVNNDRIDVFVCDPYTIYDGDHKMAMSYYLATVIDYLDWIHGDRNIDYQRVLDETKESAENWISRDMREIRTLWESAPSNANVHEPWTVDRGEVDSDIESHLRLTIDAGASAIYRPAEAVPYGVAGEPMWSSFHLSMELAKPEDVPVDIDFYLNEDSRTRARHTFIPKNKEDIYFRPDYIVVEEHRSLNSLSITNVNRFPITIHLARIEACK